MSHYSHKSIPDAKFEDDSSSSFGNVTHKISLGRREQVIKFGYLPAENGFNFKNISFYVQNCSSRPKIVPQCQFQQFSSRGKFFIFKSFEMSR